MSDTPGLADGTYDAFIIDADASTDGRLHLDVVLTAGEHKGFVVSVVSDVGLGDQFDLLGMPATLTVSGGLPSVRVDG